MENADIDAQWLTYAKQLQAIVLTRLLFSKEAFDRERHQEHNNAIGFDGATLPWHVAATAADLFTITGQYLRVSRRVCRKQIVALHKQAMQQRYKALRTQVMGLLAI